MNFDVHYLKLVSRLSATVISAQEADMIAHWYTLKQLDM
jgi:hypothetical protein